MDPVLAAICDLQEIEQEIRRAEEAVRQFDAQVQARKGDQARRRAALAAIEAEHAPLAPRRAQLESDLRQREQQRDRYEKQALLVKTQKELDAVSHEQAQILETISRLEGEILDLMDREEASAAKLEAARKKVESGAADCAAEEQRLGALRADQVRLLEGLKRDRADGLDALPAEYRSVYEWLIKRHGPPAAVPMRGEACGGCEEILPPHYLMDVIQGQEIVRCVRCMRFLIPSA